MAFKWYADLTGRWLRQLAVDVVVLAWTVFWVWLAVHVHAVLVKAAAPGSGLVSAGTGLRDTFLNAAHGAGGIPLIGHALSDALGSGASVGDRLVSAGNGEIGLAHELAFWVAVALVIGPLVLVLGVWLPVRLRYAVVAGAVARMARAGTHRELLALRALTGLGPRRLLKLGPDIVAGWRRGDGTVTDALVRAECARLGVRAG